MEPLKRSRGSRCRHCHAANLTRAGQARFNATSPFSASASRIEPDPNDRGRADPGPNFTAREDKVFTPTDLHGCDLRARRTRCDDVPAIPLRVVGQHVSGGSQMVFLRASLGLQARRSPILASLELGRVCGQRRPLISAIARSRNSSSRKSFQRHRQTPRYVPRNLTDRRTGRRTSGGAMAKPVVSYRVADDEISW